MRRAFFLTVLLLICQIPTVSALDPTRALSQYQIDVWEIADGLPQSSVHAIHQSHEGYLWIGTQEGLARFDGTSFRVFNRANTPEIRGKLFTAFAEAPDGRLWAGGRAGLVQILGEQVETPEAVAPLARHRIYGLLHTASSELWIATTDGLFRLHGEHLERLAEGELPSESVLALAAQADDSIWVGTEGGLAHFKNGVLSKVVTRADGLPHDTVHALRFGREGSLWVGTEAGLARFRGGRLSVPDLRGELATSPIYALTEDRDGNLWAGTRQNGLFRIQGEIAEHCDARPGHASGLVRALFEDREGHLWVGTAGDGLWRLRDSAITTLGITEGLASSKVYTVLEDRSGTVWLGTFGGGLHRLGPDSPPVLVDNAGLASDHIWALAEGRNGLWVGTYGDGLRHLGTQGQTRTWGLADGLANLYIRALLEDRNGDVWVGTRSGLFRLRNGRIEASYDHEDGLPSTSVYAIVETREGHLWVGTSLGPARREDERFVVPNAALQGSASAHLRDRTYDFHQDASGALWLGLETALVRLDADRLDASVTLYTVQTGLYDDLIYRILEDAQGHLWMSCNRGIFRVPRSELEEVAQGERTRVRSVAFGTADGMRSREANGGAQPAGWRRSDGTLLFPTIAGLVRIEPQRIIQPPAPPVLIEGLEVDGRAVMLDHTSTAILPPSLSRLSVRYTSPGFVAPEKVRFRFRLEGYDPDWVDAGERRMAFYTQVPPGTYRFEVAARHDGGTWGPAATLGLVLEPRFYQTSAFLATLILSIVALLYGSHHIRIRRLKARKKELRQHVDEAVAQLKVLSGLLPICPSCKKIRDDDLGDWKELELYIDERSEATFSHAICPSCLRERRPELADRVDAMRRE